MTHKIKTWNKKRKEIEHEKSLVTRRETIMFNLLNDLSIEESLNMFIDVESLFRNKVVSKLSDTSKDKILMESFLEK
jgi:hypothetical protein